MDLRRLDLDIHIDTTIEQFVNDCVTFDSPSSLLLTYGESTIRVHTRTDRDMDTLLNSLLGEYYEACSPRPVDEPYEFGVVDDTGPAPDVERLLREANRRIRPRSSDAMLSPVVGLGTDVTRQVRNDAYRMLFAQMHELSLDISAEQRLRQQWPDRGFSTTPSDANTRRMLVFAYQNIGFDEQPHIGRTAAILYWCHAYQFGTRDVERIVPGTPGWWRNWYRRAVIDPTFSTWTRTHMFEDEQPLRPSSWTIDLEPAEVTGDVDEDPDDQAYVEDDDEYEDDE